MAALEPDVEFFGIRIPPNRTVSIDDAERDRRDDDDDGESSEDGVDGDSDGGNGMPVVEGIALVHATQVALGPNPAPGRHTVMAVRASETSGKARAFPIGTLEAGRCEMFSVDLMFSTLDGKAVRDLKRSGEFAGGGDVSFMHTGASDVYITGYKTVTSLLDDERGYSDGEEEEESDEEDDDDEFGTDDDDEEAPLAVPLGRALKGRRGSPSSSSSDEEDDSSAEESEDDDDEEEEDARGRGRALNGPVTPAGGKRRGGGSESDGESESVDESESDDNDDESDDESGSEEEEEEEESESESDSDDEDEEEEEEKEPARGGKRPAPTSAAAAEASNKKAKKTAGENAPFSSYAKALRDFISANGPTKLGVLGSAVKRPESLPKLTTFLASRGDFKVDGEQRVSLVG